MTANLTTQTVSLDPRLPVFQDMIGTERIDPTSGLRYCVTGIRYNDGSRFQRESVTVHGTIVENVPRKDTPNSTMYGAYAAEIFSTVPQSPAERGR